MKKYICMSAILLAMVSMHGVAKGGEKQKTTPKKDGIIKSLQKRICNDEIPHSCSAFADDYMKPCPFRPSSVA